MLAADYCVVPVIAIAIEGVDRNLVVVLIGHIDILAGRCNRN